MSLDCAEHSAANPASMPVIRLAASETTDLICRTAIFAKLLRGAAGQDKADSPGRQWQPFGVPLPLARSMIPPVSHWV